LCSPTLDALGDASGEPRADNRNSRAGRRSQCSMRSLSRAILVALLSLLSFTPLAIAVDLVSTEEAAKVGLRPYWNINLELVGRDTVARINLVEDNLYVLSGCNN